MNKIIFICLSLIHLGNETHSQIVLDHILDSTELTIGLSYSFKPVQISGTETKYFVADTTTNSFDLLNLDFSPFLMDVNVPEPFIQNNDILQVLYISRSLFDCDTSNIEYAFYSPGNINATFRIVRTDGSIIFLLDSANGPYAYGNPLGGTDLLRPIINTSEGAKLFLQVNEGGLTKIHIYSLCGTLPHDVFDFSLYSSHTINVFPNPSSQSLNFEIELPATISNFEVKIINSNGKEVKRELMNTNVSSFSLNISNLSNGIYYYSMNSLEKILSSGKFTIIK